MQNCRRRASTAVFLVAQALLCTANFKHFYPLFISSLLLCVFTSFLWRHHRHPLPVDYHRQQLPATLKDRFFHPLPRLGLNQQHHATPSARSADLPRQGSLPPRPANNRINRLGRTRRQIAPPERPL